METTYRYSDPNASERSGDVKCARVLVRLNADECNTSKIAVTSEAGEQCCNVDACVRFVDDLDVNIDVGTQNMPLGAIRCDAVNGGQRI